MLHIRKSFSFLLHKFSYFDDFCSDDHELQEAAKAQELECNYYVLGCLGCQALQSCRQDLESTYEFPDQGSCSQM